MKSSLPGLKLKRTRQLPPDPIKSISDMREAVTGFAFFIFPPLLNDN
jgi:hypothetical protein